MKSVKSDSIKFVLSYSEVLAVLTKHINEVSKRETKNLTFEMDLETMSSSLANQKFRLTSEIVDTLEE